MNYRMAIFWVGVLVLDYFLLMGLPARQQNDLITQARIEPAHCWQGAHNDQEVEGAKDGAECRSSNGALAPVSGLSSSRQPDVMKQGAGTRLKVSLSVRPVI